LAAAVVVSRWQVGTVYDLYLYDQEGDELHVVNFRRRQAKAADPRDRGEAVSI
jgi:hypothetical protein